MVWLAKEGYDGPLVMVVPGPETEYARGVMRYRELRTQLEDELIAKLCRGELTADRLQCASHDRFAADRDPAQSMAQAGP